MRIVEPPDKTVYLVGEPFDATGIEVEGSYANGKTQSIPVENLIFGGFDSSRRASNQVVTVTYGGLTESFEVTIE